MIVVDLGCKSHEEERSIEPLIDRFHPAILFGFDPHPMLEEGVSVVGGTVVVTRRLAAWSRDGTVPYVLDGTRSRILDLDEATEVECFDFPRWLSMLPPTEIVVKLDVEGAEVHILSHLCRTGANRLVSRFLVEWHGGQGHFARPDSTYTRDLIERLACPVEDWPGAPPSDAVSSRP